MVGEYDAMAYAGGGYFYDEVLEYRVWCYPLEGAEDVFEGEDYFYAFPDYEEALEFSKLERGRQNPIALIRQFEWINEYEPGKYRHERGERIAEWDADNLKGRFRTPESIDHKLKELRT